MVVWLGLAVQPRCPIRRTYPDGGGGGGLGFLFLPLPAKKPLYFSGIGVGLRPGDRLGGGAGPVVVAAAAETGGTDQDHYAVLGIRWNATAAEVKRAYRLLAREVQSPSPNLFRNTNFRR